MNLYSNSYKKQMSQSKNLNFSFLIFIFNNFVFRMEQQLDSNFINYKLIILYIVKKRKSLYWRML